MSTPPPPPPPPASGWQSQPPAAPSASTPLSPSDDKLWGSLAHFGNILGFLPSLLIFLILKDRGVIVAREAKVALNWIITVTIAYIAVLIVGAICNGLYFALPDGIDHLFQILGLLVGLVGWAVLIVNLIFAIMNGVRVNQGGVSKYPFSLNLVK